MPDSLRTVIQDLKRKYPDIMIKVDVYNPGFAGVELLANYKKWHQTVAISDIELATGTTGELYQLLTHRLIKPLLRNADEKPAPKKAEEGSWADKWMAENGLV